MAMTDPIADLLTRIRNAQNAGHGRVSAPASRIKERIVEILVEEGYIVAFQRVSKKPQDVLEIDLKYGSDRKGAILGIVRESKPGRRVYVAAKSIPRVRSGLGVAIVSTSKGLVADHVARAEKMGGELICSVW
jgi:small subunit ribosomal protein S8